MSRNKGNAAPNWFARWLRANTGWVFAEATGAGRNGRDLTGTPGVSFELKTADDFKRDFKPTIWLAQAKANASAAEPPIVVYFPRGCGEANVTNSMMIMPTLWGMRLLEQAGYAPARTIDIGA